MSDTGEGSFNSGTEANPKLYTNSKSQEKQGEGYALAVTA